MTNPRLSPARPYRVFTRKRARPPFFAPVLLRSRRDGWSPAVQSAFLAQLFLHGSVAAAARAVGRSRASAYALRKKRGAESFAAAWDRVLTGPADRGESPARTRRSTDYRKLTLRDLEWRIAIGLVRPIIYRGKHKANVRKPDNSALLRLLRREDALARRVLGSGP